MERYPVNHGVHTAAKTPASAASRDDSWTSPENQPALLDLMHDLLGTQVEPDPLFFVETWTLGVEAATESFHARHHAPSHTDAGQTASRPFDFSVPLVFVYDQSDFQSVPANFSAAWKDAYGVAPASQQSTVQPTEAPFNPVPPLTSEDAYRLLGVPPTSTRKQIKTAYRQLVCRYHPDRLIHSSVEEQRIATERMTAINQAYRLLCADH